MKKLLIAMLLCLGLFQGIGLTVTINATLEVNGTVSATEYVGNGSKLVSVNATSLNGKNESALSVSTADYSSTAGTLTNISISQFTNNTGYLTTASTVNYATTAGSAANSILFNSQQASYYQPAATAITTNYTGDIKIAGTITANFLSGTILLNDSALTASQSYQGTIMLVTVTNNMSGAFGQAVAKQSDNTWATTNACISTNASCKAILLSNGTGPGKPVLLSGLIKNNSWVFTPGSEIYLSNTDGAITQNILSVTGNIIQKLGYAISTSTIFFCPDSTTIVLVKGESIIIPTSDPDETPLLENYFESTENWNIEYGTLALSDTAKHGLYGISFTMPTSSTTYITPFLPVIDTQSVNWTTYFNDPDGSKKQATNDLLYWVYIKDSALAKISNIQFVLYRKPSNGTYYDFTYTDLAPAWNLVTVNSLTNHGADSLTACTELDFRINLKTQSVITELMVNQFNSATGWTANNGYTPTATFIQSKTGGYGMTYGKNNTSYTDSRMQFSNHGIDLTQYFYENGTTKNGVALSYWLFIKDDAALEMVNSANTGAMIRFYQSGSNYYSFSRLQSNLSVSWNLITITGLTKTGSLTLSGATRLDLGIETDRGTQQFVENDFIWDGLGINNCTSINTSFINGDIVIDDLHTRYNDLPFPLPPSTKAFDGAEGYGAQTRGAFSLMTGRPPELYIVNTTAWNDQPYITKQNGTMVGNLKQALKLGTLSNPRPLFVVFSVAGNIDMGTPAINQAQTEPYSLMVKNSYMTIAGQTAPGGGICIKNGQIFFAGHDIIIRGLRFRPGVLNTLEAKTGAESSMIKLEKGNIRYVPQNIIYDHCSFTWSNGTNVSLWSDYDLPDGIKNMTIQWCIFGQGLNSSYYSGWTRGHSANLLTGYKSTNMSFHHNLFADSNRRNPEMNGGSYVRMENNIVFGWGERCLGLEGAESAHPERAYPQKFDCINNTFRKATNGTSWTGSNGYTVGQQNASTTLLLLNMYGKDTEVSNWYENSRVYWTGNTYYRDASHTNEDSTLYLKDDEGNTFQSTYPNILRTTPTTPTPAIPVTTQTAAAAAILVTTNAGCRVGGGLDSVDSGIISDFNGYYATFKNPATPLVYPTPAAGTPITDADFNGIPDNTFQVDHQFSSGSGWKDFNSTTGYYWIEDYVNSLINMP